MWAQAEVDEVAGPIDPCRRVDDLVGNQLHLQWLVQPLEQGDRVCPGQLLFSERWCRLDDLPHPGFDLRQLLRQEPLFEAKVVVKALICRRADADHSSRKEIEHRRGHHVRRRVAQDFEIFAHAVPSKRA